MLGDLLTSLTRSRGKLAVATLMVAIGHSLCAATLNQGEQSGVEMVPTSNNHSLAFVQDKGHEVPFPLAVIVPFPWSRIQGTWAAAGDKIPGAFRLTVEKDFTGTKLLKVDYIDPKTQQNVATGAGFASEDDQAVRAVMQIGSKSYMLTVRAYKHPNQLDRKAVTVISLRALGDLSGKEVQFVVNRVSDESFEQCPN